MSALSGRCSRTFLAVALFATLTAAIAFPLRAFAATDLGAATVIQFEVTAPSLDAPAGGNDQASAEQAIKTGYIQKLAHCHATRNAVANLTSISWDPPGYSEVTGGSGTIHDADPRLGGQFLATPIGVGRWDIQYQWC